MRNINTHEEALWKYLVKKLSILNDNNKTAKEIFNYVSNLLNKENEED